MLTMQETEQVLKRLKGTPEHMMVLCQITAYHQQSEKIEEMQRQIEFYKLMYKIQNKIIRGEMTK